MPLIVVGFCRLLNAKLLIRKLHHLPLWLCSSSHQGRNFLTMTAMRVDAKVVMLGKESVGKTSLVERYVHHRFLVGPYQNVRVETLFPTCLPGCTVAVG